MSQKKKITFILSSQVQSSAQELNMHTAYTNVPVYSWLVEKVHV